MNPTRTHPFTPFRGRRLPPAAGFPQQKEVEASSEPSSSFAREDRRNLIRVWVALAIMVPLLLINGAAAAVVAFPLVMVLAVSYPTAAIAFALATTPFQQDLGAGLLPVRFSMAELTLIFSIPGLFARGLRVGFGPGILWTIGYLTVCVVSSLYTFRDSSLVSMLQMVIYMVVAVFVGGNLEQNLNRLKIVFLPYVTVATIIAVGSFFFGSTVLGPDVTKNGVGATLSTALTVAVELSIRATGRPKAWRYYVPTGILAFGLIFSLSRGGWLAAIVGIIFIGAIRGQYVALFRSCILLVPFCAAAWFLLPQEKQEYAIGFEVDRVNIRARYESIDYTLAAFDKNPLIGLGVGLRKEYDATNIALLTLAETGSLGLICFAMVHVVIIVSTFKTLRRMNKDSPGFSMVVLAGALLLGRLAHGMVDHYWSRGPVTCAWISVGLAAVVRKNLMSERRL